MLFILDKSHEVVGSLNSNGDLSRITTYFDDVYVQDLVTGAETFTFSTMANTQQAQHLVAGNFIAFKDDGEFKLFNIIQIEETHEEVFTKTVYCEMAGIELINEIIRPMKVLNSSLQKFLTTILEGTEWQLGRMDTSFTQVFDFEVTDYKSVYELIQEYAVGTYKAEISYRVEIENGRIIGKYIDCYTERGNTEGFRFAYGSNLTSVVRTVDMSNLATALIGVGKDNLTFKEIDVEDKPYGQDFIANEKAYEQWNINGSHIFGIHKEDTESPQELLRLTRLALEERANPQIKYEMSVELLGKEVQIGDTVNIVDHEFNPPLYLTARVNQLSRSKTDPSKDEVVLANFREVSSNITDEMRNLASQLEGYIDSQFPIGGDKIQDGAINGDKLHNGQIIKGTHIFANSITSDKILAGEINTEHLSAESITADKLATDELITKSAQIADAIIDTVHIKEGAIDSIHINEGSITSAHIGDAQIGTAQIKDAEITVAKIQDAFVDNLVAKQGKFESAHIGKLSSDNISADTIKAEHITTSVIDAINMSVSGTIDASKLNVKDIVVDNIDADKITSGTIDADRINGSVISAINASIENAVIDSAKIGELSADKITSGSISTDVLKSNVISAINASIGKISADHIDVDSIKVNELDASAIVSGTIDADRITGSVVQAIDLSSEKISAKNINVEGLKVGGANIVEGSIQSVNIGKGQIENAHINNAFVADAYIKNLNASKITSGTLDTAKIKVSSTSGNLTMQDNTIQVIDKNKKVRVQLGEDKTGDYGLIITNGEGQVMWDFTGATSLGIQDDAIVNDKIKDNEITADKLVIDSIWANDAFIANFKSANIDAEQITTGKIKGEFIDIEGLVKFSDLNEELAENFVRPVDDNGKILGTYINGATIHTGTLHGDQIIANGFTAQDKLKNTTFNIDKDTGDVSVRGEVKSMNYSNIDGSEQGYLLTPDGNAYLNNATVRGSVILPSAGITNYESDVNKEVDQVRFWAGASYENRNSAPFIVYESGKMVSTEGEFGGVFSGKVNIGNIHIEDDNNSQGSISIKDNTDTTTYVHLNENYSYINSKFDVGKNFVSVVPDDKTFTVNKGDISFKGINSKYLNFPSNTGVVSEYGYTSDTYGDYKHELWYTQGTLHHNAYGTKKEGVPDYRFCRDRGDTQTSVEVKGELKVTDKITMNNKIAIVARQEEGNSGFDYVVN